MNKYVNLLIGFLTVASQGMSLEDWGHGNQHFTTTFYQHSRSVGHNFVFSPVSLQMGLTLGAELALGETQQQMLETAMVPLNETSRRSQAEEIITRLNAGDGPSIEPFSLTLANAAWLSSQSFFPEPFKYQLYYHYMASLRDVDFERSFEVVREEINDWVEQNTAHKILNFLPSGSLDKDTKLVLVNTLYMKAPWEKPFDSKDTYDAPFYGIEKSLRPIPYMKQTGYFKLIEEVDYTVVELPFKQGEYSQKDLSFFAVVPNEGVWIDELENKMTTRVLQHWIEDGDIQQIEISLPKFYVSSKIPAKSILKEMGMTRPFSENDAEFDVDEAIVISDIFHQAVFEVDEEGGTGAAGSGLVMGITSYVDPAFIKKVVFNRPFVFFVMEKSTGVVLFSGRIMQPHQIKIS